MSANSGDILKLLNERNEPLELTSITDIPSEILLRIFELTNSTPKELAKLGSVCKLWQRISYHPTVLKAALSQLSFEQIYCLFENTAGGFGKIIEIHDEYSDSDDEEFQKRISDFYSETCPSLQQKLEILLHDARITIDTKYGANKQTLCHFAAFHLDYLISWLQEKGADLNATNKNGETPLHVAFLYIDIYGGRPDFDAARELLKHNVKLNVKDKSGATPLHFLAKFAYIEELSENGQEDFKKFLDELAEKGADFLAKEAHTKLIPKEVAAERNNLKLSAWLNEHTEKQFAKLQEEINDALPFSAGL